MTELLNLYRRGIDSLFAVVGPTLDGLAAVELGNVRPVQWESHGLRAAETVQKNNSVPDVEVKAVDDDLKQLLNIQVNFSKCLQKLIWNTMGAGIGSFGKWDRTDPDWTSPKCLYFVHTLYNKYIWLFLSFVNGSSYDLVQSDHIFNFIH